MPTPPKASKEITQFTLHGHTRLDPYQWMRLTDKQKNARQPDAQTQRVLDYLNAENAYTKEVLTHTEPLQEKLYEEIIGRMKQDDSSVPAFFNGYYYYTRVEEGKEYPIYCRKKETLDASEEVLVDANVLASGHEYCDVGGLEVSPDNKLLIYAIDTVSRRKYTLRFLNLETGEYYPEKIRNTSGGSAWAADNCHVFYTSLDSSLRSYKVFRHKLGTDPSTDVEVYHEEDETYGTSVHASKSMELILIGSYSTLSTEYRFIKANEPEADFRLIQEREHDHEYGISHIDDKFYILTNWEARNFRLMQTRVDQPEKRYWKEIIPHRESVLLEDIELFKDYLVVEERENGLTHIRIINQRLEQEHYLEFDDPVYLAYIDFNPTFDTSVLRLAYSSMRIPHTIYDYDMDSRNRTLMKQQEIVGGHNPGDYAVQRMEATASGGTKIPMSVVHRKDIAFPAPCLLYGYGSYGSVVDPGFSSVRLSLLNRGFVFVIAHIRGGEYLGRAWYDSGKLLQKKNTFTDFIACADFLVEQNYTTPDRLIAMGGSAGGLLMGAVVNMRPDLFKGIVAAVPFVDVVTTMLDTDIPLTTGEYDEWGNPNEKEYYDYILSYSPYDNVEEKDYPAMLVTTGYYDSQVQYWEPAKWVAKLRDVKTDSNPLLLYCNMTAGHGGASGRFTRHRETSLEYAFILNLLGVPE